MTNHLAQDPQPGLELTLPADQKLGSLSESIGFEASHGEVSKYLVCGNTMT